MSANARKILQDSRKVVVKVGSSLLANLNGGINLEFLSRLVGALAEQRKAGREMVLVSSGAVAAGCVELGIKKRPVILPQLQAAAAVGQCALMQIYREKFLPEGIVAGQVLLSRDDLNDRSRYLYARNTLREMLAMGVLPVINENDTVAVAELKLKMGDNDALAVAVAQLIDADAIIILSDVPGLYDRPPSEEGAALIPHVQHISHEHFKNAGGSVSGVGSGGMATKLGAALGAALGAVPLVVAPGKQAGVIAQVLNGEEIGTFFAPREKRTSSWGQWIAFGRPAGGRIEVDAGAVKALLEGKKSLLPIGVKKIVGEFSEGETIGVFDPEGREVARGLVNFSSEDARKIAGKRTDELEKTLGCECCETFIHRDNLVML